MAVLLDESRPAALPIVQEAPYIDLMDERLTISNEMIDELRSRLGDEVLRLDVETGPDADGEPAVWVWVVIKADAGEEAWTWENRERIRAQVRQGLENAGVSEWVYVRFQDAAELVAHTS